MNPTPQYLWDNWITFFEVDGLYHRFSLAAPRHLAPGARHAAAEIHHWTSPDLGGWRYRGLAASPDRDRGEIAAWSGSALSLNGALYLFYTRVRPPDHQQSIGALISKDGARFADAGEALLSPQEGVGYELGEADGIVMAWRDPCVFKYKKDQLLMLFAAKRPDRAPMGCIGAAIARQGDPLSWILRAPLPLPTSYLQMEVPTLIARGGWLYCFVSTKDAITEVDEHDNIALRVYRAREIDGPWLLAGPGGDDLLLDWRARVYAMSFFEAPGGGHRGVGFKTEQARPSLIWSRQHALEWRGEIPTLRSL